MFSQIQTFNAGMILNWKRKQNGGRKPWKKKQSSRSRPFFKPCNSEGRWRRREKKTLAPACLFFGIEFNSGQAEVSVVEEKREREKKKENHKVPLQQRLKDNS